jgi:hypothetical protein
MAFGWTQNWGPEKEDLWRINDMRELIPEYLQFPLATHNP